MVKSLAWPVIETSKPYSTATLFAAARPSPEHPAYRVDLVSVGDSKRPRPCIGPVEELPDGPIYWCRSCDRRVANGKQPFCVRHKRQREQYTRDLRRAEHQRIQIPRTHLSVIHTTARLLEQHRAAMNSDDPKDRAAALKKLSSTIEEFYQWAKTHLPTATTEVSLRPLEDPATRSRP